MLKTKKSNSNSTLLANNLKGNKDDINKRKSKGNFKEKYLYYKHLKSDYNFENYFKKNNKKRKE